MFLPLRDENPTSRFPFVTVFLIAANTVIFLAGAASPHGVEQAAMRFGAVPSAVMHFRSAVNAAGFPPLLTLFTSLFIHGSLFHLLGNMLYLWIFGNNIEDLLGPIRFVFFYLACGVAAGLTQILAMPSSSAPMIGASGAIAGVLGAYMIVYPRARVKTLVFLVFYIAVVPIPAAFVLGFWFVMQLLNVGFGGGVAWFAHIGGFLTGIVLVLLSGRRPSAPAARRTPAGRGRERRGAGQGLG